MTVAPEKPDPDRIDQMLDELAALPVPDPSGDLIARVLADAEAHLPAPGGHVVPDPWWRQIVRGIGRLGCGQRAGRGNCHRVCSGAWHGWRRGGRCAMDARLRCGRSNGSGP